jgi:hypothetical protein
MRHTSPSQAERQEKLDAAALRTRSSSQNISIAKAKMQAFAMFVGVNVETRPSEGDALALEGGGEAAGGSSRTLGNSDAYAAAQRRVDDEDAGGENAPDLWLLVRVRHARGLVNCHVGHLPLRAAYELALGESALPGTEGSGEIPRRVAATTAATLTPAWDDGHAFPVSLVQCARGRSSLRVTLWDQARPSFPSFPHRLPQRDTTVTCVAAESHTVPPELDHGCSQAL